MTVENQYSAEAHGEPLAWASMMDGKVMNTTHDQALAEQWAAMGGDVRPLAFTHQPEAAGVDARRYRRLQILGAAPYGSKNLDHGTVLRFQSLDAFVDADIDAYPSRGESAQPEAAQPQPKGTAETCAICGEGKALLMRHCDHCGSDYAGPAEMRANAQAPAVEAGMVLVPLSLIQRAQQAINWHLEPDSPDEHEATMKELSAIGWPEAHAVMNDALGKSKPPVQGSE